VKGARQTFDDSRMASIVQDVLHSATARAVIAVESHNLDDQFGPFGPATEDVAHKTINRLAASVVDDFDGVASDLARATNMGLIAPHEGVEQIRQWLAHEITGNLCAFMQFGFEAGSEYERGRQ
jgi:hypothetical protein